MNSNAKSWPKLLSTNWSMLMIPVGLVFKALAQHLHNNDPENDSNCVYCGRSICDGSGICLAEIHKPGHETGNHHTA